MSRYETSLSRRKAEYWWLDPPPSLGRITVANVDSSADAEEHKAVVRGWATQMWDVWGPYHEVIREWAIAGD